MVLLCGLDQRSHHSNLVNGDKKRAGRVEFAEMAHDAWCSNIGFKASLTSTAAGFPVDLDNGMAPFARAIRRPAIQLALINHARSNPCANLHRRDSFILRARV